MLNTSFRQYHGIEILFYKRNICIFFKRYICIFLQTEFYRHFIPYPTVNVFSIFSLMNLSLPSNFNQNFRYKLVSVFSCPIICYISFIRFLRTYIVMFLSPFFYFYVCFINCFMSTNMIARSC